MPMTIHLKNLNILPMNYIAMKIGPVDVGFLKVVDRVQD